MVKKIILSLFCVMFYVSTCFCAELIPLGESNMGVFQQKFDVMMQGLRHGGKKTPVNAFDLSSPISRGKLNNSTDVYRYTDCLGGREDQIIDVYLNNAGQIISAQIMCTTDSPLYNAGDIIPNRIDHVKGALWAVLMATDSINQTNDMSVVNSISGFNNTSTNTQEFAFKSYNGHWYKIEKTFSGSNVIRYVLLSSYNNDF